MHRFGRSGQLKKDRWGGSFLVIAALAVGAAYLGGTYLNKYYFNSNSTVTQGTKTDQTAGHTGEGGLTITPVSASEFKLYVVQAGAFRSPTSAQQLATKLQSQGELGYASINTNGYSYTYVGLFSDKAEAQRLLDDLNAKHVLKDGGLVSTLTVPFGRDVITAMAGDNKTTVEKGYTAMNTYLQEVALWLEEQAVGGNDANAVTDVVKMGKELGTMATEMEKTAGTDEKLKQFVAVAKAAGENAKLLESAATAKTDSKEFSHLMNDYMSLLAKYTSLQAKTTASAQ